MDFWQSLGILARRWWIVVPGLILTAALAVTAYVNIKPTYRSTGTVVLYAPGQLQIPDPAIGGEPVRSNPFLGFGGSIVVTAEIVSRSAVAPAVQQSITAGRSGASFVVEPDIEARGPILQVTADAPTRSGAVATLDRGIAALNTVLRQQQAAVGAPEESYVRLAVLRADRTAAPLMGDRIKSVGAIVVLGTALSVALAFIVDAIIRARRHADDGLRSIVVTPPPVNSARNAEEPTRAS